MFKYFMGILFFPRGYFMPMDYLVIHMIYSGIRYTSVYNMGTVIHR